MTLIAIAEAAAYVLALFFLERAALRRGYEKGCKHGYERGRVDAEKWWIDQGTAVDRARAEFWKKELR
jgi:hypothetical protein